MREGSVDQRAFDGLMESLLTESGIFIVDNGASTFIPLWNYMLENNAVALLKSSGRRIFLHCVLTGGQALADTLSGFARLAQTTGEQNIVLWVNEYFGRVERDGRALSELPVYIEHANSVVGSVAIPRRNQDTFGRDVEDVIARKLTLQEAIDSSIFPIMVRQRLRVVQRELFDQLDTLTDSTAFSFSPMIFAYFIPAAGSAPTVVITPHTRGPAALAARQKASG